MYFFFLPQGHNRTLTLVTNLLLLRDEQLRQSPVKGQWEFQRSLMFTMTLWDGDMQTVCLKMYFVNFVNKQMCGKY